jgi:hypothetical protein
VLAGFQPGIQGLRLAGSDGERWRVSGFPSGRPRPGISPNTHTIATPTKDQRQQNGRFLHTLSASSIGGAVGYVHSRSSWDLPTVIGAISLAAVGLVLWYMEGE